MSKSKEWNEKSTSSTKPKNQKRGIRALHLLRDCSDQNWTQRRSHASQTLANFWRKPKSNIIRRTKGKRTLLKFQQNIKISPKNTRRDAHVSKTILPQLGRAKTYLSQRTENTSKKFRKKLSKNYFLMKFFGKSHSAENLAESFTLAKRFDENKF